MIDDLFAFIEQKDCLEPLIKTALVHYQFEAIHPFEDGNGRLGRLLIILMLIKYGLINEPLIYPSAYFDAHQDEYRDRLLDVSLDGNWAGWISFFLDAIRDASEVAIRRCCRFTELITEAEESLRKPQAPQMLFELLRLFASEFILTKKTAADKLEISYQVARGYFIRLEEAGIIAPYRNKARDTPYYLCGVSEIMSD
jgi:Fic family protein